MEALDKKLEYKAPSLNSLKAVVERDLPAVNHEIMELAKSHVELVPSIANHLIDSGGKRIRPLLALASANLCGNVSAEHIVAAACVELIHSATLLHDDVVDESKLRRGDQTANSIWGNKASVLVGDFLLSQAFKMLTHRTPHAMQQILADASVVIVEGEVKQLETTSNLATSYEDYLQVIGAKTAELFAAACELGAVGEGETLARRQSMREYGYNLGLAFQVIDDALDYVSEPAVLGKTPGDDFREGKLTLPVILAIRKAEAEDLEFWQRTLVDCEQGADDFKHASKLINSSGAIAEAFEYAERFAATARAALGDMPAGIVKESLLEAVDFAVHRRF